MQVSSLPPDFPIVASAATAPVAKSFPGESPVTAAPSGFADVLAGFGVAAGSAPTVPPGTDASGASAIVPALATADIPPALRATIVDVSTGVPANLVERTSVTPLGPFAVDPTPEPSTPTPPDADDSTPGDDASVEGDSTSAQQSEERSVAQVFTAVDFSSAAICVPITAPAIPFTGPPPDDGLVPAAPTSVTCSAAATASSTPASTFALPVSLAECRSDGAAVFAGAKFDAEPTTAMADPRLATGAADDSAVQPPAIETVVLPGEGSSSQAVGGLDLQPAYGTPAAPMPPGPVPPIPVVPVLPESNWASDAVRFASRGYLSDSAVVGTAPAPAVSTHAQVQIVPIAVGTPEGRGPASISGPADERSAVAPSAFTVGAPADFASVPEVSARLAEVALPQAERPGGPALCNSPAAVPVGADSQVTSVAAAAVVPLPRQTSASLRKGATEKFAAGGPPAPGPGKAADIDGVKSSVHSGVKEVAEVAPALGTGTAHLPATMPAGSTLARPNVFHVNTVELGAPAPTAAETWLASVALPATVAHAVEAALNAADRLAHTPQHSVTLRFEIAGTDLNVRVDLRGDTVHTTFRTDSAELRAALSTEWQAVSAQAEGTRSTKLGTPEFVSSDSGGTTSPDGGAPRQFEQPSYRPQPAATRFPVSRSATAPAHASPGTAAGASRTLSGNSLHLHTLA